MQNDNLPIPRFHFAASQIFHHRTGDPALLPHYCRKPANYCRIWAEYLPHYCRITATNLPITAAFVPQTCQLLPHLCRIWAEYLPQTCQLLPGYYCALNCD